MDLFHCIFARFARLVLDAEVLIAAPELVDIYGGDLDIISIVPNKGNVLGEEIDYFLFGVKHLAFHGESALYSWGKSASAFLPGGENVREGWGDLVADGEVPGLEIGLGVGGGPGPLGGDPTGEDHVGELRD